MSVRWGFLKFKANAQKCYDEITEAYGEEFTAEQVLDLAENPRTELHKCFQWDDEKAARSWRLEQARAMYLKMAHFVNPTDSLFCTSHPAPAPFF